MVSAGRRSSGAPPLGGFELSPPIGRFEAQSAGEFEGAEPPLLRVGGAGAPMLDTKGTSQHFVPSRARVFHPVRMSEREYRRKLAAEFELHASTLPKGRVRRKWTKKAQQVRGCGSLVAVRRCGDCGTDLVGTARLLTSCQLRSCPTCARFMANEARQKARALIEHLGETAGMDYYSMTFTARFKKADPAEFEIERLMERCKAVKQAVSYVWKRVLKKRPGAGMMAALEVGPGGGAHIHALYYGPRADVNVVRMAWLEKIPDSPQVKIKDVKDVQKSVPEVFKYMVKGASPKTDDAVGERMDPRLAARVEIALHGKRRVEAYGCFRGVDLEEEPPEENPEPLACTSCNNTEGPFPQHLVSRQSWAADHPTWRVKMSRTGALKHQGDTNDKCTAAIRERLTAGGEALFFSRRDSGAGRSEPEDGAQRDSGRQHQGRESRACHSDSPDRSTSVAGLLNRSQCDPVRIGTVLGLDD